MQKKAVNEIVKQKAKRPNKSAQMQVQTEPGDNAKYLMHSMKIASLPAIDKTDPKQVAERVDEYFGICIDNDMKPNVPALALSLGIDRRTLWNWSRGDGMGKNPKVRDIVKKAYNVLNVMIEDYAQNGKLNPVTSIFLLKNHFGYQDKSEVVITPNNPLEEIPDPEKLEQKYIESVVE